MLAASTAMLVPAGGALAATQGASNTTMTCAQQDAGLGCFDLYENGQWTHNVDLMTAATFCGISPVVLSSLSIGTYVNCPNGRKVRVVACDPVASVVAAAAGPGPVSRPPDARA
jgi:hypothetical protein